MINDVSCEQLNSGIVEKIDDVDQFVSNEPICSFMAHMPIFKLDKETSKCRNVFLSNLSENNNNCNMSHNQTINTGPNLNKKLPLFCNCVLTNTY